MGAAPDVPLRIPFEAVQAELERVLLYLGFNSERATRCARLFTESSCDGVYSHGLNRFPRFVKMIENGSIDVEAEPVRVGESGVLEQWDGRLGPGNLNAHASMERALDLARDFGIGCVALRNTNHWMRGGSYGWQAAEAGKIGICWTNTNQNMPPWGASAPRIGNNPLIIGIPRSSGPVVLDIAMAQFSYGALSSYQRRGESLPVDGGFDEQGRLTRDPAAIERAGRPLPIGFWKGSGLSLALDMMAALLSGGRSTKDIEFDSLKEVGLSQVFLAFDVQRLHPEGEADRIADQIIDYLHGAAPSDPERPVRYPGESTLRIRHENLDKGIPVDAAIWSQICAMGKGESVGEWL